MNSETEGKENRIAIAVLGGTGYVSGELLRILSLHPGFLVESVASTSQSGDRIVSAFPHLAGTALENLRFESLDRLLERLQKGKSLGVFAATPHAATAELVDKLLKRAQQVGADLHIVDLSADFRFSSPQQYKAIYGREHPAPQWLNQFTCFPPDLFPTITSPHATQPGCFTTAVTLAAYPFFSWGLVEPQVFASAITGSSGSGRKLGPGTHHPERRSTLVAYSALGHRHEPEMRMFLAQASNENQWEDEPQVDFVPHSGPFVRGIHATLRMTLQKTIEAPELRSLVSNFYSRTPFVRVSEEMPRLTEVVGTNRCGLGIAVRKKSLVVTSVIDNLVKGAAGGGVQWMNRLFLLPEETGLLLPGLGWF